MTEIDVARMLIRTAEVPADEDCLMIDMGEAARLARVSVDSMRSLVHRNPEALPTFKFGGAKKYLRRGDLMKFLKTRQFA